MSDRELLLERLERLAIVLDELMPQCAELVRDAIALMKEQEAVKPKLSMSGLWYECPICYRHLTKNSDNYCARCGRPVKWNDD